jgi:hypothetical protein
MRNIGWIVDILLSAYNIIATAVTNSMRFFVMKAWAFAAFFTTDRYAPKSIKSHIWRGFAADTPRQ